MGYGLNVPCIQSWPTVTKPNSDQPNKIEHGMQNGNVYTYAIKYDTKHVEKYKIACK